MSLHGKLFLEIAKNRIWCGRLLVVSLALVTLVSVIPHGSDPQTVVVASIGLDKIFHFMGFGCMALMALGAGRGLSFRKRTSLVVLVILFGIVIECIQYYIPYRTFNPVDIFANVSGVGIGIGAFKLVSKIADGS